VIVECKAPDVKLTAAVIEQITRYNMVLKVKHLIITNGHETFFCRYNETENRYEFVKEFPIFEP
jgi:hypothetical protein